MKKQTRIRVTGIVQGVFFRDTAKREARKLGLLGSVRNCPDGSVELIAQGDEEKLKQFQEWCWKGSSASRVDQVTVEEELLTGDFSSFQIIYSYR